MSAVPVGNAWSMVAFEGDGTAHCFWTAAGGRGAPDEADATLRVLMTQAFGQEDKPIMGAAYANLDGRDFWKARPVFLGIDSGRTRARRLLQEMITSEGRAAGVAAPPLETAG